MRSRLLAAAASIALAAPLLVIVTPLSASAQPYGSCVVGARLPDRFAITSSSMSVPLTVTDDAGCMDWVDYQLLDADGAKAGGDVVEHAGVDHISFFATGPGAYSAVADDGYDLDADDLVANDSNTMDARYGSDFTLYMRRSGTSIRFELKAKHYSVDAYDDVPWSGARVHLQRRSASGAWHDVAVKRTGGSGSAVLKLKSKKAVWRALLDDSPTVWGGRTYVKRF